MLVAQAPAASADRGGADAGESLAAGLEPEATPSASSKPESSAGAGAGSLLDRYSATTSKSLVRLLGLLGLRPAVGEPRDGAAGKGPRARRSSRRVKHVFVVMLDDEPYATVFGPASPAHYLAGTLEHKGALLVRYYAVAHEQLANGIALLERPGTDAADGAELPDVRRPDAGDGRAPKAR